ncbi:Archaemetzincin-2 [Cladorrhinum sp. PSN332]|nr:Archaemetzincin-2 [Cladorrhinum sp. PSN332]
MAPACKHTKIQIQVAEQADFELSFKRPSHAKRIAATTPSGRVNTRESQERDAINLASAFPAPLVLPDDLLDFDEDEKDDHQSLHSYLTGGHRRPLTARRKTIYVAQVPDISPDVSHIKKWTTPQPPAVARAPKKDKDALTHIQAPKAEDVCDYLRAFYYPLAVKLLPQTVAFVPWEGKDAENIGLQIGNGITRIRTRPPPDQAFTRQLQLNDILDAAIAALPSDAYSLVMLVDHDTYEDEEDDFCCGRAYGGSRVCMVSSARYHPALDTMAKVDRPHMWPASHCKAYVEKKCGWEANKTTKKRKLEVISKDAPTAGPGTPMRAAVDAMIKASSPQDDLDGLWFSRVARTVSHELGHCFCLPHCGYYACVMQGTAGVAEDMRQPPYLCLVCLAKVTKAVRDVHKDGEEREYQVERYKALLGFCGWRRGLSRFTVKVRSPSDGPPM